MSESKVYFFAEVCAMKLSTKRKVDYVVGGIGIFLLHPWVTLLGKILRRDHSAVIKEHALVIKMLGGGSLVIALPALLGLRRKYPGIRLSLASTKTVKPFAEVLSIFDDIMIIDDKSIITLLGSGIRLLFRLFGVDTVFDFEVYSRLSTVLSVLLCARNRIGFYLESTVWRNRISTHLIFFNRFSGSFNFYEAAVATVGAEPVNLSECGLHVARANRIPVKERLSRGERVTVEQEAQRICISPSCSELGKERMLRASQWVLILRKLVVNATSVVILGGADDSAIREELVQQGRQIGPEVSWINACDGRSLQQSLELLAGCSRLLAVDSSVLHFGRLFGIPTVSFWGPTDPATRLREVEGSADTFWYEKVPCSPCVHIAHTLPCGGRNVCIDATVRRFCGEDSRAIRETLSPFSFVRINCR